MPEVRKFYWTSTYEQPPIPRPSGYNNLLPLSSFCGKVSYIQFPSALPKRGLQYPGTRSFSSTSPLASTIRILRWGMAVAILAAIRNPDVPPDDSSHWMPSLFPGSGDLLPTMIKWNVFLSRSLRLFVPEVVMLSGVDRSSHSSTESKV